MRLRGRLHSESGTFEVVITTENLDRYQEVKGLFDAATGTLYERDGPIVDIRFRK